MKRILVGYDGSENAERALDFAIELASKFSARLFVVEVIDLTLFYNCLLYTSPSPRDRTRSRMPSSA